MLSTSVENTFASFYAGTNRGPKLSARARAQTMIYLDTVAALARDKAERGERERERERRGHLTHPKPPGAVSLAAPLTG